MKKTMETVLREFSEVRTGRAQPALVEDMHINYYETSTPNYTEDARTTLYWNPFILTNGKTKTVQIEFFNNDISKKLRLILEGVNSDGKLARVEKIIE